MTGKSLGDVIRDHQAGRLDLAEAGYKDLLNETPGNADAIHLLGVICFQKGRLEDARDLVLRAIALNDGDALYHSNLGRIEKARGQSTSAASAYRRSLEISADQADVNSDLAAALVDHGAYGDALQFAERALKLAPQFAPAAYNKGMALAGLERIKDSIRCFQRCIALDDGFADAWFQLGRVFQAINDLEQAEQAYRQAVLKDPAQSEALCNLGNILRGDGRLTEALQCYDTALKIVPDQAEIHSNRGVVLQELGQRQQAISSYRRAIELNPDDAEAHRNLAMALLQIGEYSEGWQEFEWRWQTRHFAPIRRDWEVGQWGGEPLHGKSVLVHAEQGFGDSFQFCRYVPLLAERGARVFIEAPDAIKDVLGTLEGAGQIISPGGPLPRIDYQISMMSLPGVFKTKADNIPAPPSYLRPPSKSVLDWQGRVSAAVDSRRVGIAWKGNPENFRNLWRSPGLEVFRALMSLPNLKFFSLQKDDGEKDLIECNLTDSIIDFSADLKSFSDTAAIINQLDLVITPDTSIAHLSGALGCPTWVMLPHVAEWRWGIDTDDCPWYPNTRLFRQSDYGDWESVFSKISDGLRGL